MDFIPQLTALLMATEPLAKWIIIGYFLERITERVTHIIRETFKEHRRQNQAMDDR